MKWTIDIFNDKNVFVGTRTIDSEELLKMVEDAEELE
jgi:hypothetical protein